MRLFGVSLVRLLGRQGLDLLHKLIEFAQGVATTAVLSLFGNVFNVLGRVRIGDGSPLAVLLLLNSLVAERRVLSQALHVLDLLGEALGHVISDRTVGPIIVVVTAILATFCGWQVLSLLLRCLERWRQVIRSVVSSRPR